MNGVFFLSDWKLCCISDNISYPASLIGSLLAYFLNVTSILAKLHLTGARPISSPTTISKLYKPLYACICSYCIIV